jgi:predicted RNase H-like nuclease (RuvC/YqgF family)
MKLDIVALVVGLLGMGGSIITFLAYFRVERRKRKAEARKIEREGDLKSLEYFTKTIQELVEDNKQLKKDVRELKLKVEELEDGKETLTVQLERYKEAMKEAEGCKHNTARFQCPMVFKMKEK